MNRRWLHLTLVSAQVVGFLTLLRSVAYDRWITVLTSALLIAGAMAARRGRSWGIALALTMAAWFPAAWAIGIAPAWFFWVGVAGALPFLVASRAFARFDRGATALMAVIATAIGGVGALVWKDVAWSVFREIPLLLPSAEFQHGFIVATIATVAAVAALMKAKSHDDVHVRIGEPSRVRVGMDAEAEEAEELEELEEIREPVARLRTGGGRP